MKSDQFCWVLMLGMLLGRCGAPPKSATYPTQASIVVWCTSLWNTIPLGAKLRGSEQKIQDTATTQALFSKVQQLRERPNVTEYTTPTLIARFTETDGSAKYLVGTDSVIMYGGRFYAHDQDFLNALGRARQDDCSPFGKYALEDILDSTFRMRVE